MKLFLLTTIAWSAVIPIDLDQGSNLITIIFSDGELMRFVPTLESDSVMCAIINLSDSRAAHQEYTASVRGSIARFENSPATLRLQRVTFEFIFAAGSEGYRPTLALGPLSDVVSQHHSVDFIRDWNSGRLVLGTSEESFITDNCLDGAYIRVGETARAVVTQTGERVIFFGGSVDHVLHVRLDDFVSFFGTNFLFHFDRDDFITIENCAEILRTLPDISFQFDQSGNIVITPADYTRMIGNDVCELLVFIDPRAIPDIIKMNPILIPSINIRITRDGMLICDAP